MSRTKPTEYGFGSFESGTTLYPKGWDESKCNSSELREYAVRYRIARGFERADFHADIGTSTGNTYSALVRLLLAYTAFERFERVFNLLEEKTHLEEKYESRTVLEEHFSANDNLDKLLIFISVNIEREKLKENAKNIKNKNGGSVIKLAQSIRHLFAHGVLSASSYGQNSWHALNAYQSITDWLFMVMDGETGSKMKTRKS